MYIWKNLNNFFGFTRLWLTRFLLKELFLRWDVGINNLYFHLIPRDWFVTIQILLFFSKNLNTVIIMSSLKGHKKVKKLSYLLFDIFISSRLIAENGH